MVELTEIKKESTGYIAQERLWLTTDGKIVKDGDVRAAQLLAPSGGTIPEKLAKRIGLDKGAKIEPLQKLESPKTIAPETISERSTRPESPPSRR